jgi:hypothetical protein
VVVAVQRITTVIEAGIGIEKGVLTIADEEMRGTLKSKVVLEEYQDLDRIPRGISIDLIDIIPKTQIVKKNHDVADGVPVQKTARKVEEDRDQGVEVKIEIIAGNGLVVTRKNLGVKHHAAETHMRKQNHRLTRKVIRKHAELASYS